MLIRKRLLLALCALSLALPFSFSRLAAAQAEAIPSPGFTVDAILPENQMEAQAYFSLLMEPDQNQRLWVQVNNHMDEPLHIRFDITGAQTSSNGFITYEPAVSSNALSLVDLLTFDASALQVGPGEAVTHLDGRHMTLAPQASVRLPFLLAMPHEALTGQVLGGILVTKEDDPAAGGDNGFQIKSEFSYVLAMQLQSERKQDAIAPSFSFGGVTVTQLAGFPNVSISITNDMPLVVTNASLLVEIYDDHSGAEPTFRQEAERISMAPLSTMAYALPLQGSNAFPPGAYRARITFVHQGEPYAFEGTFTIEQPAR